MILMRHGLSATSRNVSGRAHSGSRELTTVDLARTLDSGVVAADSALHLKLTTPADLRSVLAACPLRSGLRRAAAVVDFADGLAESPLESIARVVFRDGGLPPPALQVWLGGTTEPAARVDFYWKLCRRFPDLRGSPDTGPDLPFQRLGSSQRIRPFLGRMCTASALASAR